MQIAYLSDEWLDEAARLLSDVVLDPPLEGPPLALDTIVSNGDDPIRFRYRFEGPRVSLEREPGPDGDAAVVRLTQSLETAVAVAKGERSAQEAFLYNDIQFGGDVSRLIQLAGLLDRLGDALAPLRERTAF